MEKRILSGLFLFLTIFTLFFCYRHFSKEIPISYYDEEWWIEDSYFYQFYSEGNFNKNIWDSAPSKDQPMLTRFMFGAWLYPEYLMAKNNDGSLDYSRFLISNGFLSASRLPQYSTFNKFHGINNTTLQIGISGSPNELLKKYGEGISNNIHIIQDVRKLNLLLLIAAVIVPTLFFKKQRGLLFASAFLFFYGFNTLIVNSGLMAQTESIFLFFFNTSLVFMFMFYSNQKKLRYLLIFSILAGLCFSTKLNGIMLLFVFIALEARKIFFNRVNNNTMKDIGNIILSFFIILSVFIPLNPFVYPNPYTRIPEMFLYRQEIVNTQLRLFPETTTGKIGNHYIYIFNSFFSGNHVLEFNNVKFNSNINIPGILLLALFVLGIYLEIKKARSGNKFSDFMLIAFIVVGLTTGAYLQLSFPRYLVHLVLFFVYYQTVGLYFIASKIKQRFYSSTGEAGSIRTPFKFNDSTT